MIDKQILHYKILSKLGEGGMGVVYKAHDAKLDREVAIKFLPGHIASHAEERERFKIEARAAAGLNHPNIATIYAIEEADDERFIVMEYIAGRELKERIDAGPLAIDEAVRLAGQIAMGLQAAHARDVIHRDIKSANIMLTGSGDVKIMDFGLAKVAGQAKLTQAGTTLGTVAYMSPEQTRGDEVDPRSDLFSLGVLLYEMVTGQLPFKGDYDQAVTYSILNEEPEPATGLRTGIPLELERIINKCLQKDAADRYQHADELLVDLRQLRRSSEVKQAVSDSGAAPAAASETSAAPAAEPGGRRWLLPIAGMVVLIAAIAGYYALTGTTGGDPGIQKPRLAVLPFENLGSPDDEYFAAGITEEITSRLAQVNDLEVIARPSAMQYKNTTKSVQDIGSELAVNYLLQGTVRWEKQSGSESRVRVTPQLIKVANATNMWTDRYDAVLASVFAIQSNIAEQVVAALDIALLEPAKRSLEQKPTDNLEAYVYYLRGMDYHYRGYEDKENFLIAIQMYEKAIELDPGFALAYCQLARAHDMTYWMFFDRTPERLQMCKTAVDQALAIDPDLPEARLALASYYYHGFLDYERALELITPLAETESNNSEVISLLGAVQRRQGKWDEATANVEKALALDPRSVTLGLELIITYMYTRKFAEAIDLADRFISLAPDLAVHYMLKGYAAVARDGNTQLLNGIIANGPKALADDKGYVVWATILDRDFDQALRLALADPDRVGWDTQFEYLHGANQIAQIYQFLGNQRQAAAYYDSARVQIEALIAADPQDARLQSALGISHAGLGHKDEAIAAGQRGVEMLPVSQEAMRGPSRVAELMQIYVMVGEYDLALDQIEYLLSIPYPFTVPMLRLDPLYDPLRDHARFQDLVGE